MRKKTYLTFTLVLILITTLTAKAQVIFVRTLGIGTTSPGVGLSVVATSTHIASQLTVDDLIKVSFIKSTSTTASTFGGSLGIGTSTPGTLTAVQGAANVGSLVSESNIKTGTVIATSSIQTFIGGATSPTYTFIGDTDTGISAQSANTLNFIAGGISVLRMIPTATEPLFPLRTDFPDSPTTPSYSWSTAANAGLYLYGPTSFPALAANGVLVALFGDTGGGVGTDTPGTRFDVGGIGNVKGNWNIAATSTLSSLNATNTVSIASSSPGSGINLAVLGHSVLGGTLNVTGNTQLQGILTHKGNTAFFYNDLIAATTTQPTTLIDVYLGGFVLIGASDANGVGSYASFGANPVVAGSDVGDLLLRGGADYLVESDDCAFRAQANQNAAFCFMATGGSQYELRDTSKAKIWYVSLTDTVNWTKYDISLGGGDLNIGTGSATSTLTSASGLLGLGTTTPWGNLSIEDPGNKTPLFVIADTGTSTPYLFVNASTTAIMGIGTNTPNSYLTVAGSISKATFFAKGASTITLNDSQNAVLVDATPGNVTVNLPTVSGRDGREYCVRRIDATANTVTIDPYGAELIDNAATFSVTKSAATCIRVVEGVWWRFSN